MVLRNAFVLAARVAVTAKRLLGIILTKAALVERRIKLNKRSNTLG
jgi:hypothetical protein